MNTGLPIWGRINDITGQVKVFANRQYRRNEEKQSKSASAGATGLAIAYAEELQQGITESETQKILSEIKPVADQFNFIANIATDIRKISVEIMEE